MTPFFNAVDRVATLDRVVKFWMGTPFHPYAGLRGVGVDCVHLAAALLAESGFKGRIFLPRYSIEGGCHLNRKLLVEFLCAREDFAPITVLPAAAELAKGCCGEVNVPVPRAELRAGDVLIFNLRKREHCGVCLGAEHFVHVYTKHAVTLNSLNDPSWGDLLVTAFRPMEES